MRLYAKLALMVLVACATQAALSSGWASETCFAVRCLAASTTGDAAAEARLVTECQAKLLAEYQPPAIVVALNAAPASW